MFSAFCLFLLLLWFLFSIISFFCTFRSLDIRFLSFLSASDDVDVGGGDGGGGGGDGDGLSFGGAQSVRFSVE